MRRASCLLLLGLLGTSGAAQETGPGDFTTTVLTNIRSNPRHCNLDRARRIPFEALVRDYRALQGRCVAVRGYWSNAILSRQANGGRRIGLYGDEGIRAHAPRHWARRAIMAGTVQSCEELRRRADEVSGYCHSQMEGPALALAQVELD